MYLLTGVFIIDLHLCFEKGLVVSVFSESGPFSSLTPFALYQRYLLISATISLILSNDFFGYIQQRRLLVYSK